MLVAPAGMVIMSLYPKLWKYNTICKRASFFLYQQKYFSSCSNLVIFWEVFFTYVALFRVPLIFRQVAPFPPQTPHLSSLRLEPMTWSQPALMHCPWTQIDVVSGPQVVPSTTWLTTSTADVFMCLQLKVQKQLFRIYISTMYKISVLGNWDYRQDYGAQISHFATEQIFNAFEFNGVQKYHQCCRKKGISRRIQISSLIIC